MKKEKQRVCLISHTSHKWGAERFLIEAATILQQHLEVTVVIPSEGKLSEDLRKNNINYLVIPYTWWAGKNTPTIKKILKLCHNICLSIYTACKLRKYQFETIFTYTSTICVGAISAKILRIKHIWFIQEFLWEDHGLKFDLGRRFSLWFIENTSRYCLVNSQAIYQNFAKNTNYPQKWKTIYQSVELHFSSKHVELKKETSLRCMILGAVKFNKGQQDAVKAICLLKEKYSILVELFVVGSGDELFTKKLQHIVQRYDMQNYIHFTGFVDEPASWLQQADILLVCSRNEAYGRVTIEGFLQQKCVIGAASGGTAELITQSQGGLLYPVGDYRRLAEKIKKIYDNPKLGKKLAENGRKWAENNVSQHQFCQRLLNIIKN